MNQAEQHEEAVFEAALQLPVGQRGAYLDQTCGGDADLRRRVEALLGAFERAGGFLKDPAVATPARTVAVSLPPTEKPGDRIGRYKLLEQIGEGGCGVVYVAEQEEPVRRRVALKVIKLGMDTKQVIARFDAERQALAMMDHPNIAKIFDAGITDAPLPASGHPLPSSDEGRGQGEGSPPATRHPSLATSPGRPYFIMELVRGIKITDYCDQNKLSPRERLELFTQVCRAIQHAHQKGVIHRDIKPSNILVTLHDGVPVPKVIDFGIAKATQGRLTDQTVYTAFEQFIGTPAYMSPEQAEMSGLDIDTRSDIYSLGVLLYELLTGKTPFDAKELLAAGLDEMRRTIREVEPVKPSTRLTQDLVAADVRRRTPGESEQSASSPRRLQELIHLLRGDLDWIVMKCLEKDRTRRYETANGLAADICRHLTNEPVVACPPSAGYRFQKLVRRNKLAFSAMTAVTAALVIGFGIAAWQFFEKSRAYNRAVQAEKKAQTEAAKSRQVAQFLKEMLQSVGPSVALGRDAKMLREILDETAERVAKDLKEQPDVQAELQSTIGNTYYELGDFQRAMTMHRDALRLRKVLFGETNAFVAASVHDLARALEERREYAEAETLQRQALAMRKILFGSEHPDVVNSLSGLADVLTYESRQAEDVYTREGKLAEAESLKREALRSSRKLLGDENPELADSLNSLGILLTDLGKLTEAEALNREALSLCRKLPGNKHPALATSLLRLGYVLELQGRLAEAEVMCREAVEMRRQMLGNDHPYVISGADRLARVLTRAGNYAEAEALLREVLVFHRKRVGNEHPDVAGLLNRLASVLRDQGKVAEAETLYREAAEVARKLPAGKDRDELLAWLLVDLGKILAQQGKQAEAPYQVRADSLGRRGRWKEAEAEAVKALESDPSNHFPFHLLAPLLVASGDLEAYRQHCQRIQAQFAGTKDPLIAERMAKACLILPGVVADFQPINRMVTIAMTADTNASLFQYSQFVSGLAAYRQTNYARALENMRQVLNKPGADSNPEVAAWTVVAMAHHGLNRSNEARTALSNGLEMARTKLPKVEAGDLGSFWNDWIITHALLREASALIEVQVNTAADKKTESP